MGYRFQGVCHDTLFDMHAAFAEFCHATGSGLGSYYLSCSPDTGGFVVMQVYNATNGTPGTAWNYNPPQIACDSSVAISDAVSLSWQLALILVTAFGIRVIIKAFNQH